MTDARRRLSEQCNSSETRGMICGGYDGSSQLNLVDYITISSGGNAVDFGGDLTGTSVYGGNVVTPTRMVIAGGYVRSRIYRSDAVCKLCINRNELSEFWRFESRCSSNGYC